MSPRRILLTIIALLIFGSAYSAYDRFLGWIDGLPILPEHMLARSPGTVQPPAHHESPTILRLREAFGENCPEQETAFYPTQLQFFNGDTSTVVATGRPPTHPNSTKVRLSPFSVAVFGKPKPEHLRQPGEVVEITTFHSDKAILEFDRPIMTPTDMNSAKLVRLELISDPENTIKDPLGRRGYVHINNNQRSPDPFRRLQLKTVGPVFYRDTAVLIVSDKAIAGMQQSKVPDAIVASIRPLKDREFWREDFVRELSSRMNDKDLERWKNTIVHHASISPSGASIHRGPDIWTDTAIQVIDFSNLPHHEGAQANSGAVAPSASEEVRSAGAVADILLGERLPPPTVTAVGMLVYLIPDDPAKSAAKKGTAGFSGLRRIELLEQVVMHFWMEAGGGMVGSEGKSSTIIEAPPGAAAVAGGLAPALYAAREFNRDLMQIETRGPFSFDAEKNLARYEALPKADPNLTNDVRATKIPPRPGMQWLFSQVLELEFNGSPMGGGGEASSAKPAAPGTPPATKAAGTAAAKKEPSGSGGGGSQFKRLHAFTTTPGRQVSVFSDADQMEAYGQDLVRVQATEMTQFTGSPLYIVQQRSVILAGSAGNPGMLTSESVEASGGKWFKFTDLTASALKKDRVPEAVAAKLMPIRNKKLSHDEFVAQLARLLTEEEMKQHQARLLKQAALGPERRTLIQGVGRFELYDPAAKANTMAAAWRTSLLVTKDHLGDRDFDLYTFTDDAKLEDLQSDWRLQGKLVKLWMAPAPPEEGAPAAARPVVAGPASPGSRSKIDRLEARGDVTSHSADLDIEHTDMLNVLFTDVPPPPPAAGEAAPAPGDGAGPPRKELGAPVGPAGPGTSPAPAAPGSTQSAGEAPPASPAQPKEPEKPKPPMKVRARTIDSIVGRYPQPKPAPGAAPAAAAPAAPPGQGEKGTTSGGVKYQLKSARCEGMVTAHQDPDDPAKPRGTDIHGSLMIIDSEPQGSRLTVMGWDFPAFTPGEVHNEETSLIGPKIFIDQLHNIAMIEGRGSTVLPGDSDGSGLGGEKKPAPKNNQQAPQEKKPEPVVIHFRDGMIFEGTKKLAQFNGKVQATQGDSYILCHEMKVNMDKPVYFSQMNRPAAKPAAGARPGAAANPSAKGLSGQAAPGAANPEEEKAKIDVIYCYPAPADSLESPQEKQVVFRQIDRDPETGKPVRQQTLFARELTIRAQVKDDARGDPYRMVLAEGPGVTRIWAPESQDDDSASAQGKPAPAVPKQPEQKKAESEMKLTVVNFSGRMIAKDKGDSYKEATFLDNPQVVNFPTENPDVQVEFYKLPSATVRLNCTNKLVVWTHKNPRLPDNPAVQYMHAFGNAFLQNEKYDGWGDVIRSEGKTVWFDGTGQVPATIKERFKASGNSGERIRLDRGDNRYTVMGSIGGTFIEGDNFDPVRSNPPPPAKPTTPPANGSNRNQQQNQQQQNRQQ